MNCKLVANKDLIILGCKQIVFKACVFKQPFLRCSSIPLMTILSPHTLISTAVFSSGFLDFNILFPIGMRLLLRALSFIYSIPHNFTWQVFLVCFICNSFYVQGVQEKWWFFTIHCNPSLAHIALRDVQSS